MKNIIISIFMAVCLIGCSSNVKNINKIDEVAEVVPPIIIATRVVEDPPQPQKPKTISLSDYYSDKVLFSIKHDNFIEEQSKCFVKVTVPETKSHGTGIVVYKTANRTWIITCFHVVDDSLFNIAAIDTPGDNDMFFQNGKRYIGLIKCIDPEVD